MSVPPRTAGMVTLARLQERRATSAQGLKAKSLLMHRRTSLSRFRLQVTAMAARVKPGLALTKACATASGDTVARDGGSRYSAGIFTLPRALRTLSK